MAEDKKPKELLLQALEEKNVTAFNDFGVQHRAKSSSFTFDEVLTDLTEDELSNVWQSMFEMVQNLAPVLLDIKDSDAVQESFTSSANIVLHGLILANCTIKTLNKVPLGLLQMIVFLHGILFRLPDNKDTLKNNIALLCEKFWIENRNGKMELILNSTFYILKRTLRSKGTKVDVKRVWLMKDAIKHLLADEVNEKDIMFLLRCCASSQAYISCNEGAKFLEFLLSLNESSLDVFHSSIKLIMPSCSLKQTEKYGSVYYNAWMKSKKENLPELKEKLELSCIQDFMYHAIHVQRNCPRSVVPLLRKFLAVFHKKKKDPIVLRMLRDLYEPILWRALKDSNGNVRANAAQLFFDVFPLEDPDFNVAEMETELQSQLLIIKDLLFDEYPLVRTIAAIGVCLVMGCNWELIPPEMIRTYFDILVNDLACDSSSADVRCAVIKGIRELLTQNQLAVPALKVELPKLQDLFHDISDKVRMAFCQMLLTVKSIRFIRFTEIVPLEHLLARLEEDKPPIAKLIVQLISSSYFPEHKSQEFWLARCIELIKSDRSASKVFFLYVPEFVNISTIVKFMILTCRTLNLYVNSKDKKKSKSKRSPGEDKENQSSAMSSLGTSFRSDGTFAFDNPKIIAGVTDALSILWIAIQSDLQKPENKKLYKELIARFGAHMPPLLKKFKTSAIRSSVLMLCGLCPPSFIPSLSEICLSQLKNLRVDCRKDEYSVLLMCLINQEKNEEVLHLVKEWIFAGLQANERAPSKRKKGIPGKGKSKEVIPKPILGVKFLQALIEHRISRTSILKHNVDLLKDIVGLIKDMQTFIDNTRGTLDEEEKEFIFKAFSSIIKFSVLLNGEGEMDSWEFIGPLLPWTTEVFLQAETQKQKRRSKRKSTGDDVSSNWKDLGLLIIEDLLGVLYDMVLMDFIKEDSATVVDFLKTVMQSAYGHQIMASVIRLTCKFSDSSKFLLNDNARQKARHVLVKEVFLSVLSSLENDEFVSKIGDSHRSEIRTMLKDFLVGQSKQNNATNDDFDSMMLALFKSIFNVAKLSIENLEREEAKDDSAVELSNACLFMLSVVSNNEKLVKLVTTTAIEQMKEAEFEEALVSFILIVRLIKENKNSRTKLEAQIAIASGTFQQKIDALGEDSSKTLKCLSKEARRQMNILGQIQNGGEVTPPESCSS